ncbi:MAG: PAS domain-containing protein, partial [Spirochaetia bacterium]
MVPNALMQAFDDGSKTRGSQGLVAAVIESIAAAVVLYEGDLLLSANRSAELLCGVERGARVGRRFSDIVHPEHRERVTEKAMVLRLREDVPQSYEFKIVSGDGRERWVEFTTTRLDLEGKPASIGTLNDITDHRRAVTVLLETEQRYAELFENSEEGIFQGAPGGAITQANPSFSRSLGYTSPSELMALITDVSRDMFVDEQCHADLIAELTKHGRIRGFEAQLKRRDGGTVWMSISANALFADDLSLHSYNAFTRDVTQQRTMERQLLQAHKMEAVGRL